MATLSCLTIFSDIVLSHRRIIKLQPAQYSGKTSFGRLGAYQRVKSKVNTYNIRYNKILPAENEMLKCKKCGNPIFGDRIQVGVDLALCMACAEELEKGGQMPGLRQ